MRLKSFCIIIFVAFISGCGSDTYDNTKTFYLQNKKTLEKIHTKIEQSNVDISFLSLDKNLLYRLSRPDSWLKLTYDYLIVLITDGKEYSFYAKKDFKDFDCDTLVINNDYKTNFSELKELSILVSTLDFDYFHTANGDFILIDHLEYFKYVSTPKDYIKIDSNWYYMKYIGL